MEATRKYYAIRCYDPPFRSDCYYTSSGMRTEVVCFDSQKKRDEWAKKPSEWPETFRQAVPSDFVVHCPAEHANFYVKEVA
jgi:hypothetical protein